MDTEQIVTIILALVGGGGGLWAIVKLWAERGTRQATERKLHREAESIAVDTVTDALSSLSDELERVQAALNEDRQTMTLLNKKCGKFEADIERLDGEAEKWRLYSLMLAGQLDANGIPPVLSFRQVEQMTIEEVRKVFQENSIEFDAPPDDEV